MTQPNAVTISERAKHVEFVPGRTTLQIDMEKDTIWEGVTDGRPETLLEMGPAKSILSYNNMTLSYMRIRHYPLG